MKALLRKILPHKLRDLIRPLYLKLSDPYTLKSYAQEGEDMILRRVFENKNVGFYVDVGAHHPVRFSNTYFFYKMGWSGLNIDAAPGSMAIFNKLRPRDTNVEAAISQEKREMTFHILDDPALNSFDEALSQARISQGNYRILQKQKIVTQTLADILSQYLDENQEIDFLSVDVEGLDLEVLQSNNWQKFRPKCVLVECPNTNITDIINGNKIYQFMTSLQYEILAKTVNTVVFIDKMGK